MGWYGPCVHDCCRKENACLIFEDNFDRADVGADWVVVEPAWSIVNNELRGTHTPGNFFSSIRTATPIDTKDDHQIVTVRVRPITFDPLQGWTESWVTFGVTGWLGVRLRFQAANRVTIELMDLNQNQLVFGEATYTLGEQQYVVLCVNDNTPGPDSDLTVRLSTDTGDAVTLQHVFPGVVSPGTYEAVRFTTSGVASFDDLDWQLNSQNTINVDGCPPCPEAVALECEACSGAAGAAPDQFRVGVEDSIQGDCEPCDSLVPLDCSQDGNNYCLYTGSYNYGGAGLCGDEADEEELTISGSLLFTKFNDTSYQIDYTFTLSTTLGRQQTVMFQHSQATPYDCENLNLLTLTLFDIFGDDLCDFLTNGATATVTAI